MTGSSAVSASAREALAALRLILGSLLSKHLAKNILSILLSLLLDTLLIESHPLLVEFFLLLFGEFEHWEDYGEGGFVAGVTIKCKKWGYWKGLEGEGGVALTSMVVSWSRRWGAAWHASGDHAFRRHSCTRRRLTRCCDGRRRLCYPCLVLFPEFRSFLLARRWSSSAACWGPGGMRIGPRGPSFAAKWPARLPPCPWWCPGGPRRLAFDWPIPAVGRRGSLEFWLAFHPALYSISVIPRSFTATAHPYRRLSGSRQIPWEAHQYDRWVSSFQPRNQFWSYWLLHRGFLAALSLFFQFLYHVQPWFLQ